MSIIVKGLNAPERCETFTMVACYRNSGSIWCNAMNRRLVPDWDGDTEVEIDVPEWCPIIDGNWIPVTNGRGGHECSRCHQYAPSYQAGNEYLSRFCPFCGCYMGEK